MDSNEEQEITSAEDEEIVKIAKDILHKHIKAFEALADSGHLNLEDEPQCCVHNSKTINQVLEASVRFQ